MSLLLAVFLLLFSSLSAVDDVKKPVALEGVLDERTTYIPLGWNYAFICQAKLLVAHLTKVEPQWSILYFEKGAVKGKTVVAKSINDASNDRFRVHDDGTLMAFGLQKRHEGAVVECKVETVPGKVVISRNIIAIQDCRGGTNSTEDRANPCLYGMCDRWGIEDHFEAIRCNCSDYYTGQFCDQKVDGALWYELLFFSPLVTMFLGIVVLYFLIDVIEFAGKVKAMQLEQHIPSTNRVPNLRFLYPASVLSQNQIQQVEKEALACHPSERGPDTKEPITIRRNTKEGEQDSQTSDKRYFLSVKEIAKAFEMSIDIMRESKVSKEKEIKLETKEESKKSKKESAEKKKSKGSGDLVKVGKKVNNNEEGCVDRMASKMEKHAAKNASEMSKAKAGPEITPHAPSVSQKTK